MKSTPDCSERIKELKDISDSCDAVMIGAGAGLSASAGYTYSGERFKANFADFEAKYGFNNMYSGGFYNYSTPEEFWAFWSRNIYCNRYTDPPLPVYDTLYKLVKDKDYFVKTTNVDHCFQKAGFDKKRLFYTQGDYGLFQCSKPCCQKTYDNEDTVRRMISEQKDMKIPSELIPHCPECGRPMTMNLRCDDTFVQDDGWHAANKRYEEFLSRHSRSRILYLELGVGENTPSIIKYAFWRFTLHNENAAYACINYGDAYCPEEIKSRSLCIDEDIGKVLTYMCEL